MEFDRRLCKQQSEWEQRTGSFATGCHYYYRRCIVWQQHPMQVLLVYIRKDRHTYCSCMRYNVSLLFSWVVLAVPEGHKLDAYAGQRCRMCGNWIPIPIQLIWMNVIVFRRAVFTLVASASDADHSMHVQVYWTRYWCLSCSPNFCLPGCLVNYFSFTSIEAHTLLCHLFKTNVSSVPVSSPKRKEKKECNTIFTVIHISVRKFRQIWVKT